MSSNAACFVTRAHHTYCWSLVSLDTHHGQHGDDITCRQNQLPPGQSICCQERHADEWQLSYTFGWHIGQHLDHHHCLLCGPMHGFAALMQKTPQFMMQTFPQNIFQGPDWLQTGPFSLANPMCDVPTHNSLAVASHCWSKKCWVCQELLSCNALQLIPALIIADKRNQQPWAPTL